MLVKKLVRAFNSLQMSLMYKRWTLKRSLFGGAFILSLFTGLYFVLHVYSSELWPWYPPVDHWCDHDSVPDYMITQAPDEMTIATMFLDLGSMKHGPGFFQYRSQYSYRRWMRVFGRMVNRVVAYIENDDDIEYFKEIRSCLPDSLTKIIKVKREELSSFKYLPQIKHIFSRNSYPKYYPGTVYPEYACAMSAKYDVLTRAVIMDYFKTPYFAWLDIGLFRRLDGTNYDLFKLVPPLKFNPERVGMSQVFPNDPVLPLEEIVKEKKVWVSGGMVLATKEYMLNFTRQYKETFQALLKMGLAHSDQEVVHAMYNVAFRKPSHVKIKTYLCYQGQLGLTGADSRYFCLGYVCKNAWEKRVPHLNQNS